MPRITPIEPTTRLIRVNQCDPWLKNRIDSPLLQHRDALDFVV